MEKRFWHTNYDSYEQALLDKCKKLSVAFICTFNFFAQGTAFSYSLESSVGKFFVLVASGISYICVDNFICISNFHVATQFRILQYRIFNLHKRIQTEIGIGTPSKLPADYADNCYTVFKDCIRQHQALIRYCDDMEEVFTIAALAQILLFSVLICLDGYLMLLGESSPYRRLSFTFHLIGTMCQLWMFTYSCDSVLRESMGVADTVFETIWKNLPMNTSGKMFRTDLQVVMIRSRVPCCLTASGFFIVSLETYTKVLSTAASYFTLLRQY
ncbi:odorant receptor 13a-like [Lasioglossum baleicum]|uniref:odorant receptor 13a-like n=1 Tax=Lasioglossum baleicum TaxID=434251 RepID=UPI003FCD74C5